MQLSRPQYQELVEAQYKALSKWQDMERTQARGERIDLLAIEDLLTEFKKAHLVFVGHLCGPND